MMEKNYIHLFKKEILLNYFIENQNTMTMGKKCLNVVKKKKNRYNTGLKFF